MCSINRWKTMNQYRTFVMTIVLATVSIVIDAGTESTDPSKLLARRKHTKPDLSISSDIHIILPHKVAAKLTETINNPVIVSAASKKKILLKLGVKNQHKIKPRIVKRPPPRRWSSVKDIEEFYTECINKKVATPAEMVAIVTATLPPTPMQRDLLNLLLFSKRD